LGDGPPPLGFQIAVPAPSFDFPTDAGKADAFMDWLGGAVDAEVLEVLEREGRTITAHTAWQNTYIRGGYQAGVLSANAKLAAAGVTLPLQDLFAVFNAPRHADALGLLFTRNFNELRGITNAMSQAISRELAGGLAEGIGPREMARRMVDNIDNISINRATVLARTEVIRAHAEATLNRFEDFGVGKVEGLVEFQTAGDDRVCSQCEDLDGATFTLKEARGIIPVHPQCRCSWLPVIDEADNVIFGSPFGFMRDERIGVR
jgi:SPP1 gp7 family putative phage head morphogenesis protein